MSARKSKMHIPPSSKTLRNLVNLPHYQNLYGVFWIGAHRLLGLPVNQKCILNCIRFWNEEQLLLIVPEKEVNFFEIFSVNLDVQFLAKVESKHMCIHLARIHNSQQDIFGALRLPLHQFFIAFRDEAVTNRLYNEEQPVFSTDAWVPIFDLNKEKLGELECVLAVGTEKQINNIKVSRGWESQKTYAITSGFIGINPNSEDNAFPRTSNKVNQNKVNLYIKSPINMGKEDAHEVCTKSEDILNYAPEKMECLCSSSTYYPYLTQMSGEHKPLRIYLEIKMARDLPTNPPLKVKQSFKYTVTNKEKYIRFPPGEEPNTYVTFQANIGGSGFMVKSHEGMVYTTSIIEKSSNPAWNESFQLSLKLDYLVNESKRFILKVWRKASSLSSYTSVPAPLEDKIIGFISIDFTLLKNNHICDWFNIMDCFGHTNGQLKLSARCLDDLRTKDLSINHDNQVDNLLDGFETGLSINNLNLSRAIKRKFTELEEISQRLRSRLFDVTNNTEYINDLESTDEYTKEFEHDLNTVAHEEELEFDILNNGNNPLTILDKPNP